MLAEWSQPPARAHTDSTCQARLLHTSLSTPAPLRGTECCRSCCGSRCLAGGAFSGSNRQINLVRWERGGPPPLLPHVLECSVYIRRTARAVRPSMLKHTAPSCLGGIHLGPAAMLLHRSHRLKRSRDTHAPQHGARAEYNAGVCKTAARLSEGHRAEARAQGRRGWVPADRSSAGHGSSATRGACRGRYKCIWIITAAGARGQRVVSPLSSALAVWVGLSLAAQLLPLMGAAGPAQDRRGAVVKC